MKIVEEARSHVIILTSDDNRRHAVVEETRRLSYTIYYSVRLWESNENGEKVGKGRTVATRALLNKAMNLAKEFVK
mgnify:CR=1 FL=1